MEIGLRVWPAGAVNDHDPGHLFVFWSDNTQNILQFRGYVFRPSDLPEEVRQANSWRHFLFDHKVPGYVDAGDPRMLDEYLQRRDYLEGKQWLLPEEQVEDLQRNSAEGRQGWYSFNPDNHNPIPPQQTSIRDCCHNCVTWGVTLINATLKRKVVWRVRQGRVKRIVRSLTLMRDCEARRS